jgi:hypothetical protein
MGSLFLSLLEALRSALRSRADLAIENLALRQQLANFQRTRTRPPCAMPTSTWMAIPLPTGRRRPRSDADHALDVGALVREHAFDLTLRSGSRPDAAWMTGWRRTMGRKQAPSAQDRPPDGPRAIG